jgi:fumarylacetoacetase
MVLMPHDATHDPALVSWVPSAQRPDHDFPLQNLPLGVFRPAADAAPRIGVAIGDAVLDLEACAAAGLLDALDADLRAACYRASLNALFALGREALTALRAAVQTLLRADTPEGARASAQAVTLLHDADAVTMLLPAEIGDYTDFYASVHHATNVGALFRPDNPLLPNYKWVPIGYHGRASTIVPSGTPVRRPTGQLRPDADAPPIVAPTRSLDYELEVGVFLGGTQAMGQTVPLAQAERHLMGVCLVNDWSARDVQAWEYQPLGPFLAKNFATSVSPWVVTMDALAPFRAPLQPRAEGDPAPLPYLDDAQDRARGGIALTLEVTLRTAAMRAAGQPAVVIGTGDARTLYWSFAQMVAHHTMNGCQLRPGDLIASGTVSGAGPGERGCLLELTRRGAEPLTLPNGTQRRFLEDGDEVTLRGWCEAPGRRRIGLGRCTGTVVAGG